jgi:thymidylate synthase (FAD)
MAINLIWSTPNGDGLIARIARVSNPANQDNTGTGNGLIKYLIRNRHWSPFEMVSACIEINTTRDIARQILRHRSFSFQEFSQRYADPSALGKTFSSRSARLQDTKNRQNSIDVNDPKLGLWWRSAQKELWDHSMDVYKWALSNGIAKELARVVLPEGLTPSRLYMSGTLRSWIHYLDLRRGNGTQLEHREIADEINHVLRGVFPQTFEALDDSSRASD